jgi:hypothetical protein
VFGAGLRLSFQEKPLRFEFNLSTFQQPFELTVMCFGGRGFFRAALQTDGARELEGALEFGGALSFDIAVAKGGLYVMAGIYFRITNSTTDLSGFIRAGGNLSVLGIINANVEFMLAVRYRQEGSQHQLYGICTITVSIDLFMFSIDVSITMEKKIAGSEEKQRDGAARRQHSPFRLTALDATAAIPEPPLPRAYFTRTPAGKPKTDGRYGEGDDGIKDWEDVYWSQFALAE